MNATAPASTIDAHGNQISRLSIVKMSDPESYWSSYQGLVVEPQSDLEDDGCTVAVYFYGEVMSGHFNFHYKEPTMPIRDWDGQYGQNDKKSETDFLFKDDLWKRSPRVKLFRPNALVVIPQWDIQTLAIRLFGRNYNVYSLWPKELPQTADSYMCWIKDCRKPAKVFTLWNVWGTVSPFFACEECNKKFGGIMSDDMPPLKSPIHAVDGTPVKNIA